MTPGRGWARRRASPPFCRPVRGLRSSAAGRRAGEGPGGRIAWRSLGDRAGQWINAPARLQIAPPGTATPLAPVRLPKLPDDGPRVWGLIRRVHTLSPNTRPDNEQGLGRE